MTVSNHPITPTSTNMNGLAYQIAAQNVLESKETHQFDTGVLKSALQQGQKSRGEKLFKMQMFENLTDLMAQLKIKSEIITLDQAIFQIKKSIEESLFNLKNKTEKCEQQTERIHALLKDLDENKTNIASQDRNSSSEAHSLIPSSAPVVVAEALMAQIANQFGSQKIAALQNTLEYQKINDSLEHQNKAVQEQMSLLQRSQIWGHCFKIFSLIVSIITMCLTSGTAAPLAVAMKTASKLALQAVAALIQSAVGMCLTGAQTLIMKPIQKNMGAAMQIQSMREHELNQLVQQHQENKETQNQHMEQNQNTHQNLEDVLLSS